MNNRYPLILALLIMGVFLNAQNTFQAGFSFGSFDIPILTNIIQNPAGQYIMTGTDGSIPVRGTITEIDSAANVVWSKEYVSSIATEIVDVKNVTAGGYIVAGSSNPGLVLMRLDVNGATTWANTYHVASGTSENASRVLPTSDGGFVVAGYVYSATPAGHARQDSANCYILKVNSAGTLLWSKVVFCSVAYINDHVLNDVAEANDGYVFTGSMSQGASDNAGTYGLVLKTDFNGNVTYIKHWGASGNAVEGTSIISLSSTQQLIGGDDNSQSFFLKFTSSTATGSGYKYSGLLAGFPPYLNFNAVPTFDGNYAMVGMAPLGFQSYLLKVNSSTGAVIWGQEYNGGFASILPEGRQVADSGFIMVTTALGANGYEYLVVKTNSLGSTSPAGCTPTSFTPNKSTYSPTYTAFTPDSITSTTASSFSPLVLNVTPTDTISCIHIVCTPPATPTASASPSTICSGSSSTISGSGSGTTVWKVYATSTGGSAIGTAPLAVSPTVTTTYYVEASSGNGCVSTGRQAITITVTPAPSAIGSISGNTAPCLGAQSYSISSVTNATTYTWSVSGGGTITAGAGTTNITINWTTASGPYNVSVSASNSCGTVTGSVSVTVSASPTAATASALPNPACVGQNVALGVTSAGSITWAWSGPASYASTSQNPSLTSIQSNQSGVYTVTASNTCGSVTASVNVVVNAKPGAISAVANPNPACQGQTVNLAGSASGAATWSWTGPSNYTSTLQSPALSNVQTFNAGTYVLIASNTCGNDTASLNLAVNTTPSAVSATANPNPVCVGTTVNLGAAATGATTYTWSGPNSFSSTLQNPVISNFQSPDAGLYTVSATNGCGNTTATVTVNTTVAPISVSASANTLSTCFGSNIQLTGVASGATGYGWTGPNSFVSTLQNPTINNVIVADSGAYVFTAINACGRTAATVVVNVDTLIQGFSAASGSGDTLCAGYQLVLLGSGININNWLWTGPNGFTSTSQDTTVSNATSINNGQYILTASNACGNLKDTVNLYIENGSVINLRATSSALHDSTCFGSSFNLFASDSFDFYHWTGPQGFTSSQQSPTVVNASVSQSGFYIVTATNHCGSRTDSVHIYIDTIPQGLQLATSSHSNSSCQGQSITISATSFGTTLFNWVGPASFTSTQSSFTIQSIQPNQQGTYIVSDSNACGSKRDSILVTVYTLPDSLLVGYTRDSICPGLSVVLTARNGLNNIVWSNNQTGDSLLATQAGNYFYTAHDSNSCAVHSDTIQVYTTTAPVLNLLSSNPSAVCHGQQPILLKASSDPGVHIVWQPGGSTADSLVVTTPGQYSILAEENGCFVSEFINIDTATVPSVLFTDTLMNRCCVETEVKPQVTGNVSSYQWSDSTSSATDVLIHSGVYTVTVTTTQGCTASGSIIYNNVCILAHASATSDSIQAGQSTQLHVVTGISSSFTYLWGPLDSITNPNLANPVVDPKRTTTYYVAVTDSASGCIDTSQVTISVSYQADFAIPNVFAPKGNDPSNATWYVINQGGLVTVEDMKVFDRWGEQVFDSQRDGTIQWNGKYEGKLQPMGNYVYMVKVKILSSGDEKVVKGNLALIW